MLGCCTRAPRPLALSHAMCHVMPCHVARASRPHAALPVSARTFGSSKRAAPVSASSADARSRGAASPPADSSARAPLSSAAAAPLHGVASIPGASRGAAPSGGGCSSKNFAPLPDFRQIGGQAAENAGRRELAPARRKSFAPGFEGSGRWRPCVTQRARGFEGSAAPRRRRLPWDYKLSAAWERKKGKKAASGAVAQCPPPRAPARPAAAATAGAAEWCWASGCAFARAAGGRRWVPRAVEAPGWSLSS